MSGSILQQAPIVSIVSGTYNRINALKGMIHSARLALPPGITYEFVIVDGGSTDGTIDYCRAQPDIRLITHDALYGAIIAFSEGAYHARGKYVLLANDDIVFDPPGILRAIIHLEEQPSCGAVAFADDRPVAHKKPGEMGVQYMPAITHNARRPFVVYAQVGLFRKWLGDRLNWWGVTPDGERVINARTYGGDNYLSARIWEAGYTVDAVDGCKVFDSVLDDGLREINRGANDRGYHEMYPKGPAVAMQAQFEQEDKPRLRILYLPIYENHSIQKRQKRGLRDALSKKCLVVEHDYLNHPDPLSYCSEALQLIKPDIILTQFHGADQKTVPLLRLFRGLRPQALVINWNGDYWPHGLTSDDVLGMLELVDLQLVVNASVLPIYAKHDIPAAYWQIGYEEPVEDPGDVAAHDIVFLGNNYSPEREALGVALRKLPYNVGLYGQNWPKADGECLYNFAMGKALYNRARFAIGDNQFTDAVGYVSNRLFQALAAGGSLLLHQTVKGLQELTGLQDGVHYVAWGSLDDLSAKIDYYDKHEDERAAIAKAGMEYVRRNHSFDARVNELWDLIDRHASRQMGGTIRVTLPGAMASSGVRGPATGTQYVHVPPQPMIVDSRDGAVLLQQGWRLVEDANS